ncbi:phosphomannomutase CpsG [Methylophaga sp.]|uniref:phosphomannomutase CpsG n=1 Tax=Methylophaga sp. TaxID=2024840 RepID=UPI0013FFCBF0|nr:phosphomannomutase CpsG [Methylophaga sp.]MTI64696.1 phosphomannomutase CpsG [Methylophaga sp.]
MAAANKLTCFKAYDIRGQLGEELNRDVAYRIGYAYAKHLNAKNVAVGGDIRHSSETLKKALAQGLMDAGADVIDIGMVGTEELYFAAFHLDVDGAIEVTASHNPMDYNGMKLVTRGAKPISGDSGLHAIQELAETFSSPYAAVTSGLCHSESSREISSSDASTEPVLSVVEGGGMTGENVGVTVDKETVIASVAKQSSQKNLAPSPLAGEGWGEGGKYTQQSILAPYVEHLLTYIDLEKLKPLKLVVNAGNGAAGHVIDAIEDQFKSYKVPVEFIKVHHEPDGSFPNGIPNPLLPENRAATADAVIANQADMGIAWDGDFDRCFLFDENGRFIEGYYIVGLLAEAFLRKCPGEKIIHDPRLTWNTIDQVKQAGGVPIQSKTGHGFIKERMRKENAVYGGEMSAHHYFRDFAYCDSGMIPWLLVAELISVSGKSLSELVNERMDKYPCSGEINYKVEDVPATLDRIVQFYTYEQGHGHSERSRGISTDATAPNVIASETKQSSQYPIIDKTDGISLEFEDWRFNLRASNTEPLLRLNVETRANSELMSTKVNEIEKLIKL